MEQPFIPSFARCPAILLHALLLLPLVGNASAALAPNSVSHHAIQVNPKVEEWARPLTIQRLIQDTYFLDALQFILDRKDISERDKADAFYLMLKKIHWGFSGAVQIPPSLDYPATFNGYASTFLSYQDYLRAHPYDVSNLLQIADTDYRTNVVRASHALLLSVILDRKAAKTTVQSFLESKVIQNAQVPDILLHYLALSIVLVRDQALAVDFGKLWDATQSEEGREDILCCQGLFKNTDQIKSLLIAEHDPAHDLTIETGILILQRRLPAFEFASFFDEIMTSNPTCTDQLMALKHRNFRSAANTGSAFLKTWDGFDLVIYDNGMLVSRGADFSDFISNDAHTVEREKVGPLK